MHRVNNVKYDTKNLILISSSERRYYPGWEGEDIETKLILKHPQNTAKHPLIKRNMRNMSRSLNDSGN